MRRKCPFQKQNQGTAGAWERTSWSGVVCAQAISATARTFLRPLVSLTPWTKRASQRSVDLVLMLSVPDHLQTSRQQSLQGLFFSPSREWFTNTRRSRNPIKISYRPNLTRALRIMGSIYFRVHSPLGQLTKQTWRMTGKLALSSNLTEAGRSSWKIPKLAWIS